MSAVYGSALSGLSAGQNLFASAATDIASGNLNNVPSDSVNMTLGGVQVQAAVGMINAENDMMKSVLDLFA